MTLKEMKIKAFSLIEEYYPEKKELAEDDDVKNKINGVVNQIQLDLMKYRKIDASLDVTIKKEDSKKINLKETITDMYQLNKIDINEGIDYKMPNDTTLILPDDYEGTFTIYYYKYPALVDVIFEVDEGETLEELVEEYDESFEFDLDPDILEIMPYGIASDLLKTDMISNYGKYFYERYLEMKNSIDPRKTSSMIRITGGVEI